MKKVLILFEKKRKSYLCDNLNIKRNLEELFEIGEKRGIRYYRASISRYSNGAFSEAWTYKNKKWTKEENIKPDIIFDRSPYLSGENKTKEEMASKFVFANDPIFYQFGKSKFLTYLVFKDLMPKTRIAYSFNELKDNLKYIKTNKIVVKPDVGAGGKGIEIINGNEVNKIKINQYPVVVQEFIDNSCGIKNLVKGVHDLRIMFFKQKPFLSYVRQPKSGYISNVSLGGTREVVPLSKIPNNLRLALKRIVNKLKCFNNIFYSVDFFFDKNQRFYIIEINPSPSINLEDNRARCKYYKKLSEYFLEIKID